MLRAAPRWHGDRLANNGVSVWRALRLVSVRLASRSRDAQPLVSDVTPKVVNMYETRTYFPFRYEGELPESVIDMQWRQQIRSNLYSKVKFDEHLAGSTISSLQMKCKEGSMKLELPVQVEVNGVTGMMHRAHVNYFSNNIGIASITFHPARVAAQCCHHDGHASDAQASEQASTTAGGEQRAGFLHLESDAVASNPKKYERSSIKDVLDVQQAMLGNESILIDHSVDHKQKAKCSLGSPPMHKSTEAKLGPSFFARSQRTAYMAPPVVGTLCDSNHVATVQQLLDGIIDYAVTRNPHIQSWERLPFGERPFIVNRVEVDYSEELAAKVAKTLGQSETEVKQETPSTANENESQAKAPFLTTPILPKDAAMPLETEREKEVVSRGWDRTKLSTWTYALSSFAWTEKLELQDNYLEKFIQHNCYLRFASDYGGLWQGFRNNGGAAIYFHHYDSHGRRVHEDWMDDQSRWPGATDTLLQLVPSLLYQRTFLQLEVQRIRKMISKTAGMTSFLDMHDLLSELKDIEGRLLRFNLKFCDEISQDMAAQEVFDIWQRLEALSTMKENLVDHVQELSAFYRNISAATQQDKLDLLTVMVVNLGLAQILYMGLADGHPFMALTIVSISVCTAFYYHAAVLNRSVLDSGLQMPLRKFQKAVLKRLRVIAVRLPLGLLVALISAMCLATGVGYCYSEEMLELALTGEEALERAILKAGNEAKTAEHLPELAPDVEEDSGKADYAKESDIGEKKQTA